MPERLLSLEVEGHPLIPDRDISLKDNSALPPADSLTYDHEGRLYISATASHQIPL